MQPSPRERPGVQPLMADEQLLGRAAPGRRSATVVVLAILVLAFASYLQWGVPGEADTGSASTSPASSNAQAYVSALESHVAVAPRDARAWVLLARLYMEKDEFDAAASAYSTALEVSARVARDPRVLCEAADAIGMAQAGRLSGRPSELIAAALAIDGHHLVALEMSGSLAVEQGRFADAVRHWSTVLEQLPPGSSRHRELSAAIEAAQRRAATRS